MSDLACLHQSVNEREQSAQVRLLHAGRTLPARAASVVFS
jgi:hypothetical protein